MSAKFLQKNTPYFTLVSVQYCELLHEWIQYFHKLKASENAAQDHNMYANEFNKICYYPLPQQCRVSSHTIKVYQVTSIQTHLF